MGNKNSATTQKPKALSSGIFWGALGVTAFSLTVPLTRVAVSGMPAAFVGSGRIAGAGIIALLVLLLTKQPVPSCQYWGSICVVALGVVFGFPLLTSFALQHVPSSHAAVVIALLPVTTAAVAIARTQESPPLIFWILAFLGAAMTLGFITLNNGLELKFHIADLCLLGAVISAAIGYAEGGILSKSLGSWQTISWALVFALPFSTVWTISIWPDDIAQFPNTQLLSLLYLTVVSMYLGFFAWYHGISIGPMAQVSQIQLLQPVLTLVWSWTFLEEEFSTSILIAGLAVIITAIGAIRTRN